MKTSAWCMENVHFGDIQRLACRAISASAESVVPYPASLDSKILSLRGIGGERRGRGREVEYLGRVGP